MQFTKMHGAGNDYVYINCFDESMPDDPAEFAIRISDRHFGVGADGLVLICRSDVADARMVMYNADGSEAEMCGNAVRCVAKYIFDHRMCSRTAREDEELLIETGIGVLNIELEVVGRKVERVCVDMGEPMIAPEQIPTTLPQNEHGQVANMPLEVDSQTLDVTCVSMGNPHCVTFIDEPASDEQVLGIGPKIELHDAFPSRVNVEFIHVISRTELNMRVWERGSGETLACGTGASAACVAGVLTGRSDRNVTVHLPGGDLEIEWDESSNHVYMTGPAVEVFTGNWPE